MKKWKLHYPLNLETTSLKSKSQIIVYFECENNVGLAEVSSSSEVSELARTWVEKSSSRHDLTSLKLVGAKELALACQKEFEKLGFKIQKIVERNSDFEIVYHKTFRRLSLSKELTVVAPARAGLVKVFIVDDSPTIIHLLSKIFETDPALKVIGTCQDPLQAERMIEKNRPDVITMDIHMPGMDGVTLVKKLVPKFKIPIVMISSISQEEGPAVFNTLENGAVDYIQKPTLKELDRVAPLIIERVKNAAEAQIQVSTKSVVKKEHVISHEQQRNINTDHLVVIGSSTGGTEALKKIFENLPANIPPILVAQHIPAVFSAAFAKRLNEICSFEVKEAQDGDVVKPGCVYIAPGGLQMGVSEKSGSLKIVVNDDAPVNRHKPSVDYLFKTVCELKNKSVVGVMLTGMGADGAREMVNLRQKGARTIAQNQETCVVFGMPREAIERGGAEFVLPLDQIALKLYQLCSQPAKRQAS